jgi:hypothetical protein
MTSRTTSTIKKSYQTGAIHYCLLLKIISQVLSETFPGTLGAGQNVTYQDENISQQKHFSRLFFFFAWGYFGSL